jgi:segregation and condensation protein A
MTYQVRTEIFEGPFDLLLHLIAKRELDIYEVSLAAITEEYVAHLKEMRDLDLEVATEFLVVAATLIEMKAARLLPGPPAEDEEVAAERDLLVARLLEYRAFKDAAAAVRSLMADNEGYFPRTAGPGPEYAYLCPDLMARTSPEKLAALIVQILTPKPVPIVDLSHVTPIRQTVGEAAEEIRALLKEKKRMTFRELTRDCRYRIDIVVRFLALLELVKRGEADVEQSDSFGEIVAVWLGERSDSTPIADDYDGVAVVDTAPAVAVSEEVE